jgi:hypothetical protein
MKLNVVTLCGLVSVAESREGTNPIGEEALTFWVDSSSVQSTQGAEALLERVKESESEQFKQLVEIPVAVLREKFQLKSDESRSQADVKSHLGSRDVSSQPQNQLYPGTRNSQSHTIPRISKNTDGGDGPAKKLFADPKVAKPAIDSAHVEATGNQEEDDGWGDDGYVSVKPTDSPPIQFKFDPRWISSLSELQRGARKKPAQKVGKLNSELIKSLDQMFARNVGSPPPEKEPAGRLLEEKPTGVAAEKVSENQETPNHIEPVTKVEPTPKVIPAPQSRSIADIVRSAPQFKQRGEDLAVDDENDDSSDNTFED